MLTLEQIKKKHDRAFEHSHVPREMGADDLVFANVSGGQWDDNLLGDNQLAYRGQFDIIKKAIRQICADLKENTVQIDFEPVDESRTDAGDILDGMYRADDRRNDTIESYSTAGHETVICGNGAWELYTTYESDRAGNDNQVIRRNPLYEANSTVMWDPAAKLQDKSDAKFVSILKSYSEEGYKDLVEELTGERPESSGAPSFAYPEQSYTFPWYGDDLKVYVSTFYHKEKIKEKIVNLSDPFGGELHVREKDLGDAMEELIDAGYEIISDKIIERWQVTRYIASGQELLAKEPIAGTEIPVVPVYGERATVEGVEYWEGVVRSAKDPQRLRNFQLSYLADIVSRSPRPKPIFHPEQIQGFEDMYEESGAENNYPYYLANRFDADGNELPGGPAGMMPEQQIPSALIASIDLSRQAVEDVANPGLPQDIADPDLSGKAVYALQSRLDQQSVIFQTGMKHAKRRDAIIYASMAAEIYDVPRDVTMMLPDGSRKKAKIMETVIDDQTGEMTVVNDLTNAEFDVYAELGPNYQTKKDQTREQLIAAYQSMPEGDPLKPATMYKIIQLMDGISFDDMRDYARKQLVLSGISEPQTPEEEQMLMQAQQQQAAQQQQPDPNMVLAQAEMIKGQADMQDAQNKQAEVQVKAFDAETKRITAMTNAEKAGADIQKINAETMNKQVDTILMANDARNNNGAGMPMRPELQRLRGSAAA